MSDMACTLIIFESSNTHSPELWKQVYALKKKLAMAKAAKKKEERRLAQKGT